MEARYDKKLPLKLSFSILELSKKNLLRLLVKILRLLVKLLDFHLQTRSCNPPMRFS